MNQRPVILDTDWYTDVDDVMAVRLLVNLQKRGIFRILGLGISARFPMSARSLDAFLLHEGVDVPVGIVAKWDGDDSAPNGPSYQRRLAAMHSKYSAETDAEEAVSLYRRLLASSPEKVEMIGIGFEENFAGLLESAPDAVSPLSGRELVSEKVSRLWLMAGKWPEGQEYNLAGAGGVNKLITRSGATVVNTWPTPITFLGFEVGFTVLSGSRLPEDDLLRRILDDYDRTPGYGLNGRAPIFHIHENSPLRRAHSSWDPLTVLMAGMGSPEKAGFSSVRGFAHADPETGWNSFRDDPEGPHLFVLKRLADADYAAAVDRGLFLS